MSGLVPPHDPINVGSDPKFVTLHSGARGSKLPVMIHSRRVWLGLCAASLAVSLAGVGCSKKATSKSGAPLKELTVDEVQARIAAKDGKFFVFDNNSKERFTESHVPGAKWVDFKNVTAADLPSDKTASLVFYCAHPL
jgi:hypothetical protein